MTGQTYSFGIEEEYFLASARTGALATDVPTAVLAAARAEIGDSATAEFLQSQLEIASPVFHDADAALATMRSYRQRLGNVAAEHGLQLIASSTHPLSAWREQRVTRKPRYEKILADFRIVGQRNLVCGMHVHVGVPADVDRVRLMNRAMQWLPLMLALSTSSPFWNKRITGLLSYRQSVYDEWPRSGIPDFFDDEADYGRFAALMQQVDAVQDASFFWWAIRPSLRFPTLEMRIPDICTRVEDGVAIASLYRCLIAALVADPDLGSTHTTHTRRLIEENRWRAKRDGTAARLIVETSRSAEAVPQALAGLLEIVAPQIAALGCADSLAPLQRIVAEGSSAHVQQRVYSDCRARGMPRVEALREVTTWLAATTIA